MSLSDGTAVVALVRRPVLRMTEVIGHFLVQRSFEKYFRELAQQPIRAIQGKALFWAKRTHSFAAAASRVGSVLVFFVTASSVVITAPSPPDPSPAR